MRRYLPLALAILSLRAQESAQAEIKRALAANFAAMRAATSRDDIVKAVNALDTPDWSSTLPNGQRLTHADALRELEGMLAIAPEKRVSPQIDFIYWNEAAEHVNVVYWVYNERDGRLIGSLARDKWVRTSAGWRRSQHEKFFPDRPLIENGKAVILPGR